MVEVNSGSWARGVTFRVWFSMMICEMIQGNVYAHSKWPPHPWGVGRMEPYMGVSRYGGKLEY